LPKLVPYWNEGYARYVEPFMGSACLFFALTPSKALLGDTNVELVKTFSIVRDEPRAVSEELDSIPLGRESYYALRGTKPEKLTDVERAARFIFLNRFCFNGLYRTNARGEFNVPFSPQKTGRLPSCSQLEAVAALLRHAEIFCTDFEPLVNNTRKGDFVYLDPPYFVTSVRTFREYGPQQFDLSDLKRLEKALIRMDRCGASFLLSYAYCREAFDAFGRWHISITRTQRNVAGFAKHRRQALELLVTNCPSTHVQRTLEDSN